MVELNERAAGKLDVKQCRGISNKKTEGKNKTLFATEKEVNMLVKNKRNKLTNR